MPTAEIVWADPPAADTRGPRGYVTRFIDALKERPGKWAISPHTQKYQSEAYRRAARFPGTEWRNVRRDDGTFDLYGRWIGDSEEVE